MFSRGLTGTRFSYRMMAASRNISTQRTARYSNLNIKRQTVSKSSITNPLSTIDSDTYNKIGDQAANVCVQASKLLSTNKNGVFTGKETTDKAITTAVGAFASDFNSLMATVKNSGNKTYQGYADEMKKYAMSAKDDLAEVGITYNSSGVLNVDYKKLEAADIDKLKSLFNGEDSFAAKIYEKAAYIDKRVALDRVVSTYSSSTLGGRSLSI